MVQFAHRRIEGALGRSPPPQEGLKGQSSPSKNKSGVFQEKKVVFNFLPSDHGSYCLNPALSPSSKHKKNLVCNATLFGQRN